MSINKDILNEILSKIDNISHISPDDIPNIDLYMDQITTFMDDRLKYNKRYPEDKALTKTMINNYAKNKLIPAPDKKKYSKEHIILLIFIYYYKSVLSFTDIEIILRPVIEKYFSPSSAEEINLEDIYKSILSLEASGIEALKKDILHRYDIAENMYENIDNSDYLKLFTFICELSFDIYYKKQIIEYISDHLADLKKPEAKKAKDKGKKI